MAFTVKNVKLSLYILNSIFVVCGVIFFILGLCTKYSYDEDALKGSSSGNPMYAVIFGLVIVILGIVGFLSAMKENMLLLLIYGIIFLCVSGVQLIIAICLLIYLTTVKMALKIGLKHQFDNYEENKSLLDQLQQKLHCCGYDGPSFWHNSIPSSCCINEATCVTSHPSDLYQDGCMDMMWETVRYYLVLFGVIFIIVGLFQSLAAVLGLYLRRVLVRDRSRGQVFN